MKTVMKLGLATAFLLTPASLTYATAESRSPVFACEYNFQIILHGRSAQTATLNDLNTNTTTPMAQVVSGSGIRYVGGAYEFTAKGDNGTLFGAQNRGLNCQITTRAANQPAPRNDLNPLGYGKSRQTSDGFQLNIAALSYGGKIRSGPSVGNRQVGSIRGKEQIVVLRNSGISMDGYDWFEIRTARGLTGFHWGGLMCTPGLPTVGMLRECPRF